MGDYRPFLGSPVLESRNQGPRFASPLPVCRGALTFRSNRSSRNPLCESFPRVLSSRQSSCFFRKTVYDMTRQTFRIPSWLCRAFLRARNRPIIAWSFFDLHSCSHLEILWRPQFAELSLRKIMIAFCKYFERIIFVWTQKETFYLNYIIFYLKLN